MLLGIHYHVLISLRYNDCAQLNNTRSNVPDSSDAPATPNDSDGHNPQSKNRGIVGNSTLENTPPAEKRSGERTAAVSLKATTTR